MKFVWGFIGVAGLLTGCGIGDCAPVSASQLELAPPTLEATGLYARGSRELASGVLLYAPTFELWSDGAEKRRWIQLPEGGVIDTTDMDDWRFPAGTKIWKEFSRNGRVLETRFMHKFGPAEEDWLMVPYVWDVSGKSARLAVEGESNVHDTSHDVPAAQQCPACHAGTRGRVLGFSAVQLGTAPRGRAEAGSSLLSEFNQQGRFSTPVPELTLPGSALDQQALGYLHANCGSCHNQARPQQGQFRCYDPERDLDLSLRVDALADVRLTPAVRTAVGKSLIPGAPEDSGLVSRSSRRFFRHMPPLATEQVDEEGVQLIERWIGSLQAERSAE